MPRSLRGVRRGTVRVESFDWAQDRSFDWAQGRPFDFAQDKSVEAPRGHFDELSANGVVSRPGDFSVESITLAETVRFSANGVVSRPGYFSAESITLAETAR
jgi:hypothetical protein